jgi:alpha-glucosidase
MAEGRTNKEMSQVLGIEVTTVESHQHRIFRKLGVRNRTQAALLAERPREQPRDRMFDRAIRRAEMARLAEWGVRGVKVDFFHSDKQAGIQLYLEILADAAEVGLMVNFHGCTVPRGWSRTWPNLMTMEAVPGAEQYSFDPGYPAAAPWHNTILPFTRNAVGPMDYTPVTFGHQLYPHVTTAGHELALSVVFESGLLHLADSAESYRSLPRPVRDFLSVVPAVWDETRFLAGEPGAFVVVARRQAEAWYVGGITGDEAREIAVALAFLESGSFSQTLITDGRTGDGFDVADATVDARGELSVAMPARGGFVARLEPSPVAQ